MATGQRTQRDDSPPPTSSEVSNIDAHATGSNATPSIGLSAIHSQALLDADYRDFLHPRWSSGSNMVSTETCSEHTTTTNLPSEPSLTHSGETVSSSRFSAHTSLASAVSGVAISDPFEPGSGPQHNGRELSYDCPFYFLNCRKSFIDKEAWKMHALYHFRRHQPPSKSECPLCAPPPHPQAFVAKDDIDDEGEPVPGSAWDKRMDHVGLHHENGYSLAAVRPEFELYTFLWRRKIINDACYRKLKGNWSTDVVITMMGGRQR